MQEISNFKQQGKGNQEQLTSITIIQPDKQHIIKFPIQLINLSLKQFKQKLIQLKILRYSSRIHFYNRPLASFNNLNFIDYQKNTFKQLRQAYPNLVIAYNNTQFKQQSQFQSYQHNIITNNNPHPINIIVQIAQNNSFVHQKYSFQQNAQISFLKSLLNRYGHSIFVQYYSMRISISSFGDNQSIKNSISKLKDKSNRLTLYVSRYDQQVSILTISNQFNLDINHNKYIRMNIQNFQQSYLIDKKVNWKVVSYIFSILFKQKIYVQSKKLNKYIELTSNVQQNQVIINQKQNILNAKISKSNFFSLEKPFNFCNLVGVKNSKLYLIENSHIIHIFQVSSFQNRKIHKISSFMLQSTQTRQNDQDYAFLTEKHLIMYNITINHINLKYYDINNCQFLFTKRKPYLSKIYRLQFNLNAMVFDYLTVTLKQQSQTLTSFRVFPTDNPQKYINIQNVWSPSKCKVYFAKNGLNSYTDRSGIFAFLDCENYKIIFYSFFAMDKICQIKLDKSKISIEQSQIKYSLRTQKKLIVSNIFFSQQKICKKQTQQQVIRNIGVTYLDNDIYLYQLRFKKQCFDKKYKIIQMKTDINFRYKLNSNQVGMFLSIDQLVGVSQNYLRYFDKIKAKQQTQNKKCTTINQQKVIQKQQRVPLGYILISLSKNKIEGKLKQNPFVQKSIQGFYFINQI